MFLVGSKWRKWDLHIHTPASYHWGSSDRFHKITEEDAINVINAMQNSDSDVFSIQDYWTFDGYKKIREILKESSTFQLTKTVLPGMELRISSPTNFRLNIHVILSDQVSDDDLNTFQNMLKIVFPDGSQSLSKTTLMNLARTYSADKVLKNHPFKDPNFPTEEELYLLGAKTAVIEQASLQEAVQYLNKKETRAIVMLPYDTYNGLEELEWDKHPAAQTFFMQFADCFEAKYLPNIQMFLHQETPKNRRYLANVITTMAQKPKPSFRGSDAHSFNNYGLYPNEKITWIKADPTFKGLIQALNQPSERTFIGELPPQISRVKNNPTKYIHSLQIKKKNDSHPDEPWFDEAPMLFNDGLVVILGNKGSGKSALVDILAVVGNTRRNPDHFSFLHANKFTKNVNRASWFEGTIRWQDSTFSPAFLDKYARPTAEKVLYVPQHFFETICNDVEIAKGGAFDQELKEVIFSHVPFEERLGQESLNALIDFLNDQTERAILQRKEELRKTNLRIIEIEHMQSSKYKQQIRVQLDEKEAELRAHIELEPMSLDLPQNSSENTNQIQSLRDKRNKQAIVIQDLKRVLGSANEREAKATKLQQALETLMSRYFIFKEENTLIAEDLGLNIDDLISISTNVSLLEDAKSKARANSTDLHGQIETIENEIKIVDQQIFAIQDVLAEEERGYQQYLNMHNSWRQKQDEIIGDEYTTGTIKYLEHKLSEIESLPDKISETKDQRRRISMEIYALIRDLFDDYARLMQPVQKFLTEQAISGTNNVTFDVRMEIDKRFSENFFEYLNLGRKGSFQGKEEGLKVLKNIISTYNFDSFEETWSFINSLMEHLMEDKRENPSREIEIEQQLKQSKTLYDLYEFIFEMDYIRPNYVFKLDGKDLTQLSPGERGILLLIFYLLIDPDDRPMIIDQPEENLDNGSIQKLLVPYFKHAKKRRQIFIVTHNPNITIGCDADQVIYASMDKREKKITYRSGSIEDEGINEIIVEIQEGTWPAFRKRGDTYIRIDK